MADNVRVRRRWPLIMALLVLVLLVFAVLAVLGNRRQVPDRPLQQVKVSAEQLALGRYAARAADCAACHQTADGPAFAGGFPLKTPFGTIYGTNITPDPDHGIGRWTADEFYRAVALGQAPGGRNLYPAMPYTAYHDMTREDSDLIYGYLMNQRPSAAPNRPPDVGFPFNLRILLSGWNLLFFDKDPLPAASQGSSEAWQRGRYLSNVMGHCAECHTPRGVFGQVKRDEWLSGYQLTRFLSPDLRPAALAERGWTPEDLRRFMRTGMSRQATASEEMYPVILHSSQYLSDVDLEAMAVFLFGDSPPPARPLPDSAAPGGLQRPGSGHQTYLNLCAGCHGAQGEGKPHTMPDLAGNSTVRMADPHNLLVVILDGLPAADYPGRASALSGMPGFARRLSDAEIAELATYVRGTWGGRAGDVAAEDVKALRAHN